MGASGQVMTDACEDLAVKEVVKLVKGAGLLRRRPKTRPLVVKRGIDEASN